MSDTPTETTADIAAASDGGTTLLVADFSDTESAWEAYEALKSVEDGRHVAIDGVVVVKRDAAITDVAAKDIRALADEAEKD